MDSLFLASGKIGSYDERNLIVLQKRLWMSDV